MAARHPCVPGADRPWGHLYAPEARTDVVVEEPLEGLCSSLRQDPLGQETVQAGDATERERQNPESLTAGPTQNGTSGVTT